MYCNNCGKHNPDGSKFCQHCGINLSKKAKSLETKENDEEVMSKNEPPYPYVISVTKLVVLSITTFGLYEVYWFYKQFKSFKSERKLNWTPWARAIFSGLMSYTLFSEVSKAERSADKTRGGLEAGGLAIVYLILAYSWKLPEPYWWISMFSFLPLIPAQKAINFYWEKKYDNKIVPSSFGGWNYLWAIAGGLLLLLAIWGTIDTSSSNSNTQSSDNVYASPTPDVASLETTYGTNFMNSCDEKNDRYTFCNCILSYIRDRYSLNERTQWDIDYANTKKMPQGLTDASNYCSPSQ